MDWTIKISTGNAVWENIKTWGPPVVTLLLGIFIGSWREWRGHRRKVQNMRLMIYGEVQRIRTGIAATNHAISKSGNITEAALALNFLTETPVYDAYLDQLSKLSTDELTKLDALYFEIATTRKESLRISTKVINKEELTNDEGLIVKWETHRILEFCIKVQDCMERYTGREGKSIKAAHIRRVLPTQQYRPHYYSNEEISKIIGCEPEEVDRIRTEMLMSAATTWPTETDENSIDEFDEKGKLNE